MKSKRSQATSIPMSVKREVWGRDDCKCIYCKSPNSAPVAHVISRAYGGLGVAKNIVTVCANCHRRMDNSTDRRKMIAYAKRYLRNIYGEFNDEDVKYKK